MSQNLGLITSPFATAKPSKRKNQAQVDVLKHTPAMLAVHRSSSQLPKGKSPASSTNLVPLTDSEATLSYS